MAEEREHVRPTQPTLEERWAGPRQKMIDWHRRARESQLTNYAAADRCDTLHLWLGIPAIIFSGLAAAGAFKHITKEWGDTGTTVMAFLTVGSALLASLQTFLKFSERAEKHRAAGARYGAVRRTLEKIEALLPVDRGEPKTFLDAIEKRLDDLASQSPLVSKHLYDRTMANAGPYSALQPEKQPLPNDKLVGD
jgi:hypothetical protein